MTTIQFKIALILILAFSITSKASSALEFSLDKVIDFLNQVISNSFPTRRSLLYISDGSTVLATIIDLAIIRSNATFVTMPDILEQKYKEHNYDGYIIVSENITFLRNLFMLKPKDSAFRIHVHRRVVIFFNGYEDFTVYPFSHATTLQGVDIITVSGVDLSFKNYIWTNQFSVKDVTVNQVVTRKVIASWDYFSPFYLDKKAFAPIKWNPYFETEAGIQRLPLKVAVANCRPFIFANKFDNVFDGIEYRILAEVGAKWLIEYDIQEFDENANIQKRILDEVVLGSNNMGLCSQWVTVASLKADQIDFTHPYTQLCTTFLVPKPRLLPLSSYVFHSVHEESWFLQVVLLIIMPLVIWAISKKYEMEKENNEISSFNKARRHLDLITCFLDILRAYTMTALPEFPSQRCTLLRFVFCLWFLTDVILYTGYSAGLTLSQTFPRYTKPITTLKDMVDADIHWGGPDYSQKIDFGAHPNPYVAKLLTKYYIEENHRQRNYRLQRGEYGLCVKVFSSQFVTDTESLDEYGKTHLKLLSECASESYLVMILNKNSPFTKLIGDAIRMYIEHGLIEYWTQQVLIKYRANYSYTANFHTSYAIPISEDHMPMSLEKIQGAFYLLIGGWLLAAIVFFLELWTYKKI